MYHFVNHYVFPFRFREVETCADAYFEIVIFLNGERMRHTIAQLASECVCLSERETWFREFFFENKRIKMRERVFYK